MDFSLKQLGLIVISIAAIILTALLVKGVVDKTEEKIESEMDKLDDISTEYVMPANNEFPEVVFYC